MNLCDASKSESGQFVKKKLKSVFHASVLLLTIWLFGKRDILGDVNIAVVTW